MEASPPSVRREVLHYDSRVRLAARRQATYDDLLALPEHVIGEIVGGELVVSPRPAMLHAGGATALGATLLPPFQFGDGGGPGGWRIFFEPELHLSDDIVVPELAGWRLDRMPAPPTETFMTLRPIGCVKFFRRLPVAMIARRNCLSTRARA